MSPQILLTYDPSPNSPWVWRAAWINPVTRAEIADPTRREYYYRTCEIRRRDPAGAVEALTAKYPLKTVREWLAAEVQA
jgi:hypothetical protein